MRRFRVLLLLPVLLILPVAVSASTLAGTTFQQWLQDLRAEAATLGISAATLDAALDGLSPVPRVLELDRSQPEFTRTFWRYLDARVNEQRIRRGRQLLKQHEDLFRSLQEEYGVPARFLVAFWGLETSFGDYLGVFPVLASLATLAHDERRSEFFRAELLDALRIVDAGHIDAGAMKGSWAGAMGNMQFLPSTFVRYAIDADRDGRKDVWGSVTDAMASAANYLRAMGWRTAETWGRQVRLPDGFDVSLARPGYRKPLAEWASMGVRRADDSALPAVDLQARLILPQGAQGPAFLVYNNFDTILRWNRSNNYAIAVGHLADRLIGGLPLTLGREVDNRNLTRAAAIELQQRLTALGFDAGSADGIPGPATRAAVRAWQRANGQPADGYPSLSLLEVLREVSVPPAAQEKEQKK